MTLQTGALVHHWRLFIRGKHTLYIPLFSTRKKKLFLLVGRAKGSELFSLMRSPSSSPAATYKAQGCISQASRSRELSLQRGDKGLDQSVGKALLTFNATKVTRYTAWHRSLSLFSTLILKIIISDTEVKKNYTPEDILQWEWQHH